MNSCNYKHKFYKILYNYYIFIFTVLLYNKHIYLTNKFIKYSYNLPFRTNIFSIIIFILYTICIIYIVLNL